MCRVYILCLFVFNISRSSVLFSIILLWTSDENLFYRVCLHRKFDFYITITAIVEITWVCDYEISFLKDSQTLFCSNVCSPCTKELHIPDSYSNITITKSHNMALAITWYCEAWQTTSSSQPYASSSIPSRRPLKAAEKSSCSFRRWIVLHASLAFRACLWNV